MTQHLQSTKLPHTDLYIHVGDTMQYKDEPIEKILSIEQRPHGIVAVRTTDNSHPRDIVYTAADLGVEFAAGRMVKVAKAAEDMQ